MKQKNIVFKTLNLIEAKLIKSVLEGSGIDVYVYDENISMMEPFYSRAVGGIKLLVSDEQLEKAKEILKEYRGKEGQDPSVGKYTLFGIDVTRRKD